MTEAALLALVRRRLPRALSRSFGAVHAQNRRLWDLEDRVRATRAAASIARLKRAIDRTNLARHAAVKVIDLAVLTQHPRGAMRGERSAVIDSSSIGQMLDRLSILVLKRTRIAAPAATALARAQWEHAIACLERALAALAAGRWVHHAAGEVKQYGALSE